MAQEIPQRVSPEQFAADKKAAKDLMGEAMKILANEPASMQFFSLIDLQFTNDPEVTMRQCVKNSGVNIVLEINPTWAKNLGDPSILAWLFGAEAIRLALQHSTRRATLPAQSNKLASDLLCYEDTRLLSRWRDEVKKVLPTIPSWAQVAPVLTPLGFNKSTDWYKERLKAYIDKIVAQHQQQQQQQRQSGQQQQQGQCQQSQQNQQGQNQNQNGQGQGQSGQQQGNQQQNGQGQGQNGQGGQDDQTGQNQQGQGQSHGEGEGQGQGDNGSASNPTGKGNNRNGEGTDGRDWKGHEDSQAQQNKDEVEGQNSQNNGQGQNQYPDENLLDDIRGERPKTGDPSIDALNRHFDCGERNARKATGEWGENTSVSAEIKRITEWLGSNPEMWGNISGSLQEAIRKANKPKFDPTKITRQFAAYIKDTAKLRKRNKTNRRHPELAGLRHKTKCSMGFFTDVSGSMSDADVAMGMAWMEKFIKHAETYYAFWDAECGPITRLKKPKNDGVYDVCGRGGTDPRCIIRRLEKEKIKLGGIVVFTDNGFDWPEPPAKWKHKIFIIGTRDCCNPPVWCKKFLNVKDIDRYLKERAGLEA